MPVVNTEIAGFLTQAENIKRAINITTIASSNSNSTSSLLASQWTNPNDVLSVLLIIGGDIVQKALAQTAGGPFTPVCFSFGWVAYSYTALVGVIGDGRLLPDPDYPVKVFNLKNGYARENQNWVIGRLLRDNEMRMSKTHPLHEAAIRISIYEAKHCDDSPAVAGSGYVRFFGLLIMILQLGIATIPLVLYREWGVFLITASGTLLALSAGQLPQWRAEKLPNKQKSYKNFALTTGNGARDIMIILGGGKCLDLEELSAARSPRSTRIWESIPYLSLPVGKKRLETETHSDGTEIRRTLVFAGIPIGFWLTIVLCTVQSVLWIGLLITVAGLKTHTWYLLLVGGIGMFQNAVISSVSRDPRKRNLPILHVDTIIRRKVMDGLMDLEVTHTNAGRWLLREFFPGEPRKNEVEWWAGAWKEGEAKYDIERKSCADRRGMPRSMQPRYHSTLKTEKGEPNENSGEPDTQAPRKTSLERDNRITQMGKRRSNVNTPDPPIRMWPLSDASIDSRIAKSSKGTPISGPTPVSSDVGRVRDGKAYNHGNTLDENLDFQSPDRQDTGSSRTLSWDEMNKVTQFPEWVD